MKYAEDNERMGVKEYAVAAAIVAWLFMVAICFSPVAYSIGKYVGYDDGYEDAMSENREEHYLTD